MKEIIVKFVEKNFIMGIPELRKSVHSFIDHADERFLRMVKSLANEYSKNSNLIGFNPDGTPITKQEMRGRVKAASKRVKAGQFLTQEEVDKEVENW